MANQIKKAVTVREAVQLNFRDILKVISFDDLMFADSLEGDEKLKFLRFCSETYTNPFFLRISAFFVWSQVMLTANEHVNADQYLTGQMMIQGIKTFEDFFAKYSREYDEMVKAPEEFDSHASFSKARLLNN